MSLVPHRFLFRVAYPCRYVKGMPAEDADRLLDLPDGCRIDNFAAMDERKNFADVRLAWNELGLGVQVEVNGKEESPQGSSTRPRGSDGVTLWIDTRDARTSHRASRYCHQFHFLPTGGGPDGDEPVFGQVKINRALQDAPCAAPAACPSAACKLDMAISWKAFCRRQCSTASTRSRIRAWASTTWSGTRSWANRS